MARNWVGGVVVGRLVGVCLGVLVAAFTEGSAEVVFEAMGPIVEAIGAVVEAMGAFPGATEAGESAVVSDWVVGNGTNEA